MSTITLTGNYGYTPYRASGLAAGTTIDAETASWIQSNDGSGSNDYPFQVNNSPGAVVDGGTINGQIDQTSDWRTVYEMGNSAAIRTEDAPDVVIRDWRISDTWDAIRVSWNSQNFLIEDVWVTNARDDAVENDRLQSGAIRDSLFDGVFAGLSIDPSSSSSVDGHNETVTFDGVLMRLQPSLYEGEMTHASLIKTDSVSNGALTPNLRFTNNVFAIEDVEHHSYRSMFDAWSNTVESSGNVFLNLSDKPLPDDYPKPPSGWTILQGQQARDYWQQAKADWIAKHPGSGDQADATTEEAAATKPTTTDADPVVVADTSQTTSGAVQEPTADAGTATSTTTSSTTPPATTTTTTTATTTTTTPSSGEAATFSGVSFTGTEANETIIGNSLNNKIDGDNGDDVLKGGAGDDLIRGDDGVDQYWGGLGADTFFFKRTSDSRESTGVDTIMDFTKGDKIDLSNIDANTKISGDQAFELISGDLGKTPGQVKFSFDSASGETVVTANVDTDTTAEFTLRLHGNVSLTSSDFIF